MWIHDYFYRSTIFYDSFVYPLNTIFCITFQKHNYHCIQNLLPTHISPTPFITKNLLRNLLVNIYIYKIRNFDFRQQLWRHQKCVVMWLAGNQSLCPVNAVQFALVGFVEHTEHTVSRYIPRIYRKISSDILNDILESKRLGEIFDSLINLTWNISNL